MHHVTFFLTEKYFDMNKKNCKEGLDIYKKFITRMDRVSAFLKVAEDVGFDKEDIPDLSKVSCVTVACMTVSVKCQVCAVLIHVHGTYPVREHCLH